MGKNVIQTDQLLVFAGLSCAGKTTLIEQIQKGNLEPLSEQLGIIEPDMWTIINAVDLSKMDQDFMTRLILHYDIYSQYSGNERFNYLTELIDKSKKVLFVTLYASPEALKQRIKARLINSFNYLLDKPQKYEAGYFKGLFKIYQNYCDSRVLLKFYDLWFKYCEAQFENIDHWIVDSNNLEMVARPIETVKADMLPHIKDTIKLMQ